ncbi:hypothetical protein ZIOFF_005947 [Zingiber officinale]|uniref:Uncharacterized protein n=1 Tax=Zingiber officinale TaxID=94328 RepID=A0A8J5LS03_ZINOF|nr:hypothetical protein ZIOFF_005947 [Zingiber officinale]
MEGVGARLGRSSTRYGPATVFSGPVRKWKKRWITVATPNNSSAAKANGNAARSRLLLYKWAPVSSTPADGAAQPEEHPPRNFRYVPVRIISCWKRKERKKREKKRILAEKDEGKKRKKEKLVPDPPDLEFLLEASNNELGLPLPSEEMGVEEVVGIGEALVISVLEEQKQEDAEKLHETYEPSNVDLSSQINRNVSADLKPDMNDILMGESMAASDMDQNSADDNNLANLDLNLGLKGIDNERETKSRNEGDDVEKLSIGEDIKINGTNSEAANKMKRKAVTPDLEM